MTVFGRGFFTLANKTCSARKHLLLFRQIQCSSQRNSSSSDGKGSSSSLLDSLNSSSNWRKGQLNTITDKFKAGTDPKPEPMKITSDDDVQQTWKDMESRVVRRRTMDLSEAKAKGKKVGRRNVRKTDEEVWLDAGLYDEEK